MSHRHMDIQVRVATILLGKAEPPLPSARFNLSVDNGIKVDGLIGTLGLPPRLIGSVIVNSRRSGHDRVLAEGDVVAIVPAISGG